MGDIKSSCDLDWLPVDQKFSTLAVHAGYTEGNKNLSSIVPPITISANFEIDVPAVNRVNILNQFKKQPIRYF